MVIRVTLSLDPVDVDLIDRLAALQNTNRSQQVREVFAEMRPMLKQTVETFEAALRQRDDFLRVVGQAEAVRLSTLAQEVDRVQSSVLGSLSRLEGSLAAHEAADPRSSNHGGHTPQPPYLDDVS